MKTFSYLLNGKQRRRGGFTIIELLTVVSIMVVISTATISVVPSLLQSNRFTQNVILVSALFDQARQHAITNNTYVWVAFTDLPTANPSEGAWVVVLESKEGVDAFQWNSGSVKLSDYPQMGLLGKVRNLSDLNISSSSGTSYSWLPTVSSSGTPAPINLTVPFAGKNLVFKKAIQFTPTGEAKIAATTTPYVDMEIERATQETSPNIAVLRVAGITGKTTVFRAR
jgi:prepilin-type N-terminal cleavage/methylation domain-containing protein